MGFPKLTIAKPVMKILTHPEVYLGKGVLKICSKFTGEHPYGSVISINLEVAASVACKCFFFVFQPDMCYFDIFDCCKIPKGLLKGF